MNEKVTAWLRTVIPSLWGTAVAYVLARYALPAEVADLLNSPVALLAVTSVGIGVWYGVWRKIEPHVPDWLSRLALGSAKTPTYNEPGVDETPVERRPYSTPL